MAPGRWYVVQTMKGQEIKAIADIKRDVIADDEDVFIMENEKMFKHQGKWEADRVNLFPGYTFVETSRPEEFNQRLHKKHRTLKLMTVGETITAIRPEEELLLKQLGGEEHIVRYSEGFRDGDKIIVESGPLKGHEGEIRHLDRHNRQAQITMSLFGIETNVTLGLGIVKVI
ncbi:MAG: antiterminator LoaP [Lachnospiraceae bacterium]|nr:antiterminator LoaP [Lachnospiraceae bacterium]